MIMRRHNHQSTRLSFFFFFGFTRKQVESVNSQRPRCPCGGGSGREEICLKFAVSFDGLLRKLIPGIGFMRVKCKKGPADTCIIHKNLLEKTFEWLSGDLFDYIAQLDYFDVPGVL